MSNEIVVADFFDDELVSTMKGLLEEQTDMAGNPINWFGRIKMSRESARFSTERGGVESENNPSTIKMVVINIGFESRALFARVEGKGKLACFSPIVKRSSTSRSSMVGKWVSRDVLAPQNFDTTDGTSFACICKNCKWSQFGTMKEWDTTRQQSGGPACGNRGFLFGFLVNEVSAGKYELDGNPWVLSFPGTSFDAFNSINIKSIQSNVPVQALVFQLSVVRKGEGANAYSTLKVDKIVGTVKDKVSFKSVLKLKEETEEAFESYATILEELDGESVVVVDQQAADGDVQSCGEPVEEF